VDFRLSLPKIGTEAALNLQMIQLQLDHADLPGKVPPDIVHADEQPGDADAFALCFHYHTNLLLKR
jgi:hypothetical protein